jgi:hypothetical protein
MAIAFVFVVPIGFIQAIAVASLKLILAGVGICSSVIPVCLQPARRVAAAPSKLRAAVGAAARNGDHHGHHRSRAGSNVT